jgi:hypothetical protein
MATAPKTASFVTGVAPPQALQARQLALEEEELAQALMEARKGLTPGVTSAGRYGALNLDGLANAMVAGRASGKLKANRAASGRLQEEYQRGLAEALGAYSGADLGQIRAALNSPYPEVRSRAADDLKALRERSGKLADRARFQDVAAGEDPMKWQPKQDFQVTDGTVLTKQEGQIPTRVAGGWEPGRLPNGTQIDTNTLTGKRDAVDKAPRVGITNVVDKADSAGAAEAVKATLARADELRRGVTGQTRALASMEEASRAGAFQGPVQNWVQGAAGLARQFGLADDEVKQLLSNTETLQSDAGRFVLSMVRALGANPSNADREYAERTAGGAKLSPEGLQSIIRAARADIANTVYEHNLMVDQGRATGVRSYELGRIRMPAWRPGDLEGFEPDSQGVYMPRRRTPAAAGAPDRAQQLEDIRRRYQGGNP